VLEGKDMGDDAREEIGKVIERMVSEYTPGDFMEDWDIDGLFSALEQVFPVDVQPDDLDADTIDRGELTRLLTESALRLYDAREAELGEELMRALERFLLLQIIDERWREHLYDMDYLREGIHLRGFAQIDPLVAYKNEAFELFGDLMNSLWSDFSRMIFHVQVTIDGQNGDAMPAPGPAPFAASGTSTRAGRVSYSGGSATGAGAITAAAAASPELAAQGYADGNGGGEAHEMMPVVEQRRVDDEHQLGRNDPCWCGSGKKYKKCHGA
jgi:preprotein translocase subunit SecA